MPLGIRFTITVTSVNDEQVLVTNTGATVVEGSTGNVITTAMLETTDVDNTDGELIYTITTTPGNGILYNNGVALGVSDTFSQSDIDAGLISYSHDGAESALDGFDFTVDDGQGTSTSGTFHYTVTPVNDEQVLVTNTGATVVEGSTGNVITTAMLETTDVDNTDGELIYTITTTPGNGILYNNGVALGVSDTFSQSDIDAGLISYSHDGAESALDGFDFTVDDGQGTGTSGTFHWAISNVNDVASIESIEGSDLNYTENDGAVAITSSINLTDVDDVDLESAVVQITGNYVNGEDVLSFTNQNGITGNWNATTGTLTLTGTSSVSTAITRPHCEVLLTVTAVKLPIHQPAPYRLQSMMVMLIRIH